EPTPETGLGPGAGELGPDVTGWNTDPSDQFADNLNQQVNDMQDQTDQVIAYAEHSPGFGSAPESGPGINPEAAEVLHADGVDSGIQASVASDFYARQAQTDTGNALQDGDTAIDDAQVALATPDDADE
ncbi:MAG: hypothetical protein ACRDP5_28525, partial [Streptosporangiaceae bacterium]